VFPWPALAAQCVRGELVGEVTYVRDGDTIELGSMAIRFEGIAAPEWNEPGAAAATAAIKVLVLGKGVRCELTGKPTYDRCVAVCYLNGVDV
jgi:endonuclease YncB( thermonuclease family)